MRVSKIIKKNLLEIIFIIPLLIFISWINVLPIIRGVLLGFQLLGHYSTYNYEQLATPTYSIVNKTMNTVIIVALALSIEFALALLTSLLLNRNFRGRTFFRSIVMLPYGVATVVSAIGFTFIFAPSGWYGNEILLKLGLIHSDINWIKGPIAFLSVAVADSWKTFPLIMLILLGGLQTIPDSLYEAAAIDGASKIQQFRHITIPSLFPFIMIALIIRAVSEFNILSLPLILVGNNLLFLGTLAYDIYISFSLGSANLADAVATILLVIVMLFVALYIYASNRLMERGSDE